MTELSPAAKAILEAYDNSPWEYVIGDITACVAVLRAVADQVVPDDPKEAMHFTSEAIRLNKQGIRRKLNAIADELEGGAS